jgi:hypothetical protein
MGRGAAETYSTAKLIEKRPNFRAQQHRTPGSSQARSFEKVIKQLLSIDQKFIKK